MAELTKLGRYELRSVLGKGAMGVVYEGFDPSLNRPVAVKTILKSVVTDEETAAAYSARFVREAKAAARLSHANIVQVYDFGEQDDIAFLVMEFIQGRELRACFDARERFEPAEAVRIMGELLGALEFAHESGVIHRDVKSANVMLDAQRRVKLADFGVARIQEGTDRSKSGAIVGTPAFMSPEQISGGRVDRRTDVFSAGIVLYQLLTSEQPFKGEGAWTVAKQIMQDEPPRPSTIATRVSPAFDQIVNRALAKKPDQRYASAKEFSAALQEALSGGSAQRGGDAEIEFWRSIQNSSDPAEYEVYLKEFPAGVYAELARIKIAKLPLIASGPERDTAEVRKLADETARLEAELAQREAAYKKREAEAEAKRLAEEQARAEANARREAEVKVRAAAEEKARLAAIEKAQQEAKAEVARREADIRQREAEFRKREAEAAASAAAAAKADADASARRQAEERSRREAEAKWRAEAEEKAKRQREELARRQAEIKEREADLKRRVAQVPRAKLPVLQLAIGVALVAGAIVGAWYWSTSSDEARLAQLTIALEAATNATQELNVARERQQELRRQVEVARLAEDDARAKGDQAKLKELQEQTRRAEAEAQKQNELVKQREAEAKKAGDAAKVADAQKQGEASKAAAEKAAQEKAAQAKVAELAAVEKAAAEKAATEKVTADKAAVEKLAAAKVAADKAAVPKTAVRARPGLPSVGDRWTYEAKDSQNPELRYLFTVDATAIAGNTVTQVIRRPKAEAIEYTHRPAPALTHHLSGIFEFSPYLRAFHDLREGQKWEDIDFLGRTGGDICRGTRCSINGRVVGREKISVKAGTFDATKVVLLLSIRGIGPTAMNIELRYWFAEAANRIVKFETRAETQPYWSLPHMEMELVSYEPASRSAEKSSAPVSVAAIAPEGVLPGRYAFRMLPAVGSEVCGRIDVQEDIEIRAGSSQSVSGRDFRDFRFQSAPADSVAATLQVSTRMGSGDAKLTGRATAAGHAGSYVWRAVSMPGTGTCTGEWSLVRKGSKEVEKVAVSAKAPAVIAAVSAPEGVLPGRYAFRLANESGSGQACEVIDVQEDIEVRAGVKEGISGKGFANLRFQAMQDGSVTATMEGVWTRYGTGDVKLAGRSTAVGYAGTYEWRFGPQVCSRQWTLLRK